MVSSGYDHDTPGRAEHASAPPGVWLTDAALLAMAIIWGVNYSVVKYATGVLEPLAFNALRVALAAVVLLIIGSRFGGPQPPRRTIIALILLGVLGNGLYQVLFVEGIARTRAGDAALIGAASPAFMAIIGRMRGVERVGLRGVNGIVLSLVGMALVVWGSHSVAEHTTAVAQSTALLGDALILAGSLCWALYTVLLKPYTHDVHGIQLSAWTMVGGALVLVSVGAPGVARTAWSGVPALGWSAVLYSGIGALVIAYLFWYRGVRVIGPTRAAMYSNLQPIIALIVAWAMLGETPTVWQGVGTAAITGGLLLTRS
jgi:drug/metabolite transporter (DMT)-like permease